MPKDLLGMEAPDEIWVEIFGWCLEQYSLLRCTSKKFSTLRTPYDGWDSLIAQEVRVYIEKENIHWMKNNKLHSPKIPGGRQLPALEDHFNKFWYRKGKLHRDPESGLPAIIRLDQQEWWVDGKRHREGDLPAIYRSDGRCKWYLNGEFVKWDDDWVYPQ